MAEIVFNRIKMDSGKFIIPMAEVQIIDGRFNQEYVNQKVFIDSGEVVEQLNRDTKVFCIHNGIKVKLEVVRIKYDRIKEKGYQGEDYLVFQPSSKFLKESYFDGINIHNLPTIYEYLMDLNIVRFSYESLLKAKFKDVDFCIDYPSTIDDFRSINKNIEFNVLLELKHFTKQRDKYLGLQFNEREKATPTRPFIKNYHKTNELINHSNEFYFNYLKDNYSEILANGVGRYEITVKDASFKKHYKIESLTIEDLLNISSDSIQNMFKRFLPNYLYKSTRNKKMGTTPTEIIHSNCINQFIHEGKSEQEILHLMLKGIEERSSFSRSKKLLQELLTQVQEPEKLIENNNQKKAQNVVYKIIGLHSEEI